MAYYNQDLGLVAGNSLTPNLRSEATTIIQILNNDVGTYLKTGLTSYGRAFIIYGRKLLLQQYHKCAGACEKTHRRYGEMGLRVIPSKSQLFFYTREFKLI